MTITRRSASPAQIRAVVSPSYWALGSTYMDSRKHNGTEEVGAFDPRLYHLRSTHLNISAIKSTLTSFVSFPSLYLQSVINIGLRDIYALALQLQLSLSQYLNADPGSGWRVLSNPSASLKAKARPCSLIGPRPSLRRSSLVWKVPVGMSCGLRVSGGDWNRKQ
jgi:hypothetical protein